MRRAHTGRGDRVAAGLLAVAGVSHAALGIGAIAGAETFQANVDEIERTVAADLFSSLGTWGVVMLALGTGEALAARAVWRGSRNGWLAAQIASFLALGVVLLTLGIFRLAGALTIPLCLAVNYLLAHHSRQRP